MVRLTARFRSIYQWLKRARLAIISLTVVIFTLSLSIYIIQTEQSIRVAGLCLQLLGLIAAAIGIRDTRRLFDKPSFFGLLRKWGRDFPRHHTRELSARAETSVSISATADGIGWRGVGPTLESRLDAIEENLQTLRDRFDKESRSLRKKIESLRREIASEKSSRKEVDQKIHLQVEAASADGLHLAAIGVVWLAFGIVLTTVPMEILNLIG